MISILIPSRGRPADLARAIGSFLYNAHDSSNIEVFVGLDSDDNETLANLPQIPGVVFVVGGRSRGYEDLHLHLNRMAKLATGEWLVFPNDDTFMRTEGWDTFVLEHDPDKELMLGMQVNYPHAFSFPIVSRRVIEVTGHASLFHGIDAWLYQVITVAGLPTIIENRIELFHANADLPDYERFKDKTHFEARETQRRLNNEGDVFLTAASWRSLIQEDTKKLRAYLESV